MYGTARQFWITLNHDPSKARRWPLICIHIFDHYKIKISIETFVIYFYLRIKTISFIRGVTKQNVEKRWCKLRPRKITKERYSTLWDSVDCITVIETEYRCQIVGENFIRTMRSKVVKFKYLELIRGQQK